MLSRVLHNDKLCVAVGRASIRLNPKMLGLGSVQARVGRPSGEKHSCIRGIAAIHGCNKQLRVYLNLEPSGLGANLKSGGRSPSINALVVL